MADESLPDLITRRLGELDVSFRVAADRSGGLVSASTLSAIANGTRSNPRPQVMEGIALALDVSLRRVQKAAGVAGRLPPFVLPQRADQLTEGERRAVMAMIDVILRAHR